MELGLDAILESAEEDYDELSDYEEEEPNDESKEAHAEKISAAIASTLAVAPSFLSPLSSQLSIDIPPPALEEGEIGSPSGGLQLGCDLRFTDNDVDIAMQKTNKTRDTKRKKKKKKRRQEKRKEGKGPGPNNYEEGPGASKRFIFKLCRRLKEPKIFLIEAAIERLGFDVLKELVREVDTIEAHGGQMTVDGRRRRTPGGVLWNVLRARYREEYKAVMASAKDIQEKLRKRKVDEDRMDIDEQPAMKRRRTVENGSRAAPLPPVKNQASQVKNPSLVVNKTEVTLWPFQKGQMDSVRSKLEPENSRSYTEAVYAWAQSVKTSKCEPISKELVMNGDDVVMHEVVPPKKAPSVTERVRAPVMYDDLLEI